MTEEPKGRVEIILPGEESTASRLWVTTKSGEIKVIKLTQGQSLAVAAGLLVFLFLGFMLLSGAFMLLLLFAVVAGAFAYIGGLLGLKKPR
jgi:hypothetical protein